MQSFALLIAFAVFSALCAWAVCNFINKSYGKKAIVVFALAILATSFFLVMIGIGASGPFAFLGIMMLAATVCFPAFLTSVLCAIFMSEP
jgi:hypothetical protein